MTFSRASYNSPSTSTPSTSLDHSAPMTPFGSALNTSLMLSAFGRYLDSIAQGPQRLATPLEILYENSIETFTHSLGGNVFGTKESLKKYQSIMTDIETNWPALTKLIEAQQPHNRVAIFTVSNNTELKQAGIGGGWGPIELTDPQLKQFSANIMVEVNQGKSSICYTGHEWMHEVQSFRHDILSGKNPSKLPISLSTYFNYQDEVEVVTCWHKGFANYQQNASKLPPTDPCHTIYGKPATHYEKFVTAMKAGKMDQAKAAWTTFTGEIGTYLTSARLNGGHEAIHKHASELSHLIDKKLGIELFTKPTSTPTFRAQLWSCTKQLTRRGLQSLGAVFYGLDVYHEYSLLPETHPNRNAHALINGTTRHILGMGSLYTNESMFYDTTSMGSGAEAMQTIEKSVGKEQLQEILKKGNAWYVEHLSACYADPYCPVAGVVPMKGAPTLSDQERETFFCYLNAQTRDFQESIQGPLTRLYDTVKQSVSQSTQGPLTWLYDTVKQSVSQLFLCHAAEQHMLEKVVNALGAEIQALVISRDVWDLAQQTQIADTLRSRAETLLEDVPKLQSALPPERIAAALPASSTAAPITEERSVHPIMGPEQIPAIDPLYTTLINLHQEAELLNDKLNTETQENRLVDIPTLEKIEELTDNCEKTEEELQKRWDEKGAFYTTAMECVGVIATQLDQQFRYRRAQKAQNVARREERRAFEHQKKQLKRAINPPISYVEIEKFAHDMYSPERQLRQTIVELRSDLRALSDRLKELKARRSARETAIKAGQQLSHDMDRNDRALFAILEEELKQQEKIGKNLNLLSILIGASAGIMTAFACPAAYIATATTATAVTQVTQTFVGEQGDRRAARLRKAQTTSLYNHQRVAQTVQTQQYELNTIEGQIQLCHQLLLNKASWCDSKQLRKFLRDTIKEQKQKIEDNQRLIDELTEALEVDDPKTGKTCWNTNVELATTRYNKYKRSSDRKPESKSRARRKEQARQELNYATSQQQEFENQRETAINKQDDLIDKQAKDEKLLKQQRFLAPMNKQIEAVIMAQQKKFDFERYTEDNEALGIRAGDLTERGLAQQQLYVNINRFNQELMQERQLMFSAFHASKGLFNELGHFLNTRKPTLGIELGEQLYRVVDLYRHFSECSVPQFQKLIKTLELEDASFLEKVSALRTSDIISIFVIPGAQIVAACLAAVRLGQTIMSKEPLTSDQQFTLNLVEKAFQEHQKVMNEQFNELKELLNLNQARLTEDLRELQSDVGFIAQELHTSIEESKKAILGQLSSQNFQQFTQQVESLASQWRERDRIFWNTYATLYESDREVAALKYLGELEASLPVCSEEHLNGLTFAEGKWQLRFTPSCMATAPQYVAGAIALSFHLEEPVPNQHLFKTLSDCIERIRTACPSLPVQMLLTQLDLQMQGPRETLKTLASQGPEALKLAIEAQYRYIQTISEAKNRMRLRGISTQLANVTEQIDTLLSRHEKNWLNSDRVGEHKFLISELIHDRAMGSGYTPNLTLLQAKIDAQSIHDESKSTGKTVAVIGGVGGLPIGGPVGAGFFAGVGSVAGYAGRTLIGYTGMALKNAFEFTLNAGVYERERKISHMLNRSPRDFVRFLDSRRKANFSVNVEFSNQSKRYEITAFKLKQMVDRTSALPFMEIGGQDVYSATQTSSNPKNTRTLIAFSCSTTPVIPMFGGSPRYHGFASRSLIQQEDMEQVPPPPITTVYAAKSKRMLRCYFECLRNFRSASRMDQKNPFAEIGKQADFIHSATGEFLPLAMPKSLLRSMEKQLFDDNFQLMATNAGSLIPSFQFRKDLSGTRYSLTLDYKFIKTNDSKLEEHGSFLLATFDRNVVESFSKITFSKKTDDWDYDFGEPNLQEFLIQAFYGHMFRLGLPGKGTVRLTNAELFVPQEVPFAGLYTLFSRIPDRTIHYTSEFDGENYTTLLGAKPLFRQGRHWARIWFGSRKDGPKENGPEAERTELTPMEQAAKTYAEKYYLARSLYNLSGDITPEDIADLFERFTRLFSPTRFDRALAQALLCEGQSSEQEQASDMGFINIGNSCWMNVCLQWFHQFPSLRHSVIQALQTDGKEEVAQHLHKVLRRDPSSTPLKQATQLEHLRTSLFTSHVYEGALEGLHDPADLLAGRTGSSPLSYLTVTDLPLWFPRKANLEETIQRAVHEHTDRSADLLPEDIVVEYKRNRRAEIPAPENQTIKLRGQQYAIVGLIEYVEISTADQPIGHYIAYSKDKMGWTRYDDHAVSPEFAPPIDTAVFYLLHRLPGSPS